MLIAKHYVKVNGTIYPPGEEIDVEISKEKLERLLSKGAVENKTAPSAHFTKEPESEPELIGEEEPETEDEAEVEDEAPEVDVMAGIVQEKEEDTPKKPARSRRPKGEKAK